MFQAKQTISPPLTEPALWSFLEDLEHKSIWDVVTAYMDWSLPVHHYEGTVTLTRDSLDFTGKHKTTSAPCNVQIPRQSIRHIQCGFDDVFKARDDKYFGLEFKPLRIVYTSVHGRSQALYCVVDFNRLTRGCSNKQWADGLKEWMAAAGASTANTQI